MRNVCRLLLGVAVLALLLWPALVLAEPPSWPWTDASCCKGGVCGKPLPAKVTSIPAPAQPKAAVYVQAGPVVVSVGAVRPARPCPCGPACGCHPCGCRVRVRFWR